MIFKSKGTYRIDGVVAFAVENPSECTSFEHLIKKKVEIDGSRYFVSGVERFSHCTPWAAGEIIGLCVEQLKEAEKC